MGEPPPHPLTREESRALGALFAALRRISERDAWHEYKVPPAVWERTVDALQMEVVGAPARYFESPQALARLAVLARAAAEEAEQAARQATARRPREDDAVTPDQVCRFLLACVIVACVICVPHAAVRAVGGGARGGRRLRRRRRGGPGGRESGSRSGE